MELSGKIYKILTLETGEGKNGTWKKQDIILEMGGKYPKKVKVTFWGDLADKYFAEGKDISVEFDVESREFNGKWYTEVKVWRINTNGSQSNSSSGNTNTQDIPSDIDEEIPF